MSTADGVIPTPRRPPGGVRDAGLLVGINLLMLGRQFTPGPLVPVRVPAPRAGDSPEPTARSQDVAESVVLMAPRWHAEPVPGLGGAVLRCVPAAATLGPALLLGHALRRRWAEVTPRG